MLTLYRRHLKTCPHTSRKHRQCKCPLWIDGTIGREDIRRALDLSSWDAGQRLVREIESAGNLSPLLNRGSGIPSIAEAVARFFEDATDRNLSPATISKYDVLLKKQLLPFCDSRGFTKLKQLGIQETRDFRGSWADAALAASKKLERLRCFFRFCLESKRPAWGQVFGSLRPAWGTGLRATSLGDRSSRTTRAWDRSSNRNRDQLGDRSSAAWDGQS